MWLARQLQQPGRRHHLFPSSSSLLLTSLRLFSPSAGSRDDAPAPSAEPAHFMVDYLVSSCGLSGDEALRASKPLAHLKSSEKPDAVLRRLRQEGLGDADIKHAVLRFPRVLRADAKKTLEPKIRALQEAGIPSHEIAQIISTSPRVIFARDVLRRVEFWRKLVGTNQNVLKAMRRDPSILCYSLDNKVIPRLSLLRSLGVPDNKMGTLIMRKPRLVSVKPDRIIALVEQVKSLGFPPGSPMFLVALPCLGVLRRSTFDAKSKLLRSFGWTQAELISAILKCPCILGYSEKKIRATMDFLLNEAGYEPSYIARLPTLVTYSLERRLKPRFHILQSLKLKALLPERKKFYTAVPMTEDDFIHKYIIPYSDEHPELLEAYHAVCAKNAKADTVSM